MGRQLLGVLGICVVTCVGCGGPSYGTPVKVTGKVTVAGQPAKDVNIIFQAKEKLPADKRTAQAAVNADGTYAIEGVYPADYDVFLQSSAPIDLQMNSAVPTAPAGGAPPVNEDGTPVTKPAKVPTDTNEFNFDF